jgi:hypothetical protein
VQIFCFIVKVQLSGSHCIGCGPQGVVALFEGGYDVTPRTLRIHITLQQFIFLQPALFSSGSLCYYYCDEENANLFVVGLRLLVFFCCYVFAEIMEPRHTAVNMWRYITVYF